MLFLYYQDKAHCVRPGGVCETPLPARAQARGLGGVGSRALLPGDAGLNRSRYRGTVQSASTRELQSCSGTLGRERAGYPIRPSWPLGSAINDRRREDPAYLQEDREDDQACDQCS